MHSQNSPTRTGFQCGYTYVGEAWQKNNFEKRTRYFGVVPEITLARK